MPEPSFVAAESPGDCKGRSGRVFIHLSPVDRQRRTMKDTWSSVTPVDAVCPHVASLKTDELKALWNYCVLMGLFYWPP